MKSSRCLIFLCSTFLAASSYGQTFDLKHLDKLAEKATETANVTLDGSLLQIAAKFLSSDKADEAKIKKLIAGLKGIYVRSFEFDKEGEYSEADVNAIRNQLRTPEWSRLVEVRSKRDGENAEIFLRTNHEQGGLAIIAASPKELTVVNIVGKIDLDELSDLGGNLGVPKLELEKTPKPAKKEHD